MRLDITIITSKRDQITIFGMMKLAFFRQANMLPIYQARRAKFNLVHNQGLTKIRVQSNNSPSS